MLDNEVWKSLQRLPKGVRNRYINEAVAERLQRDQCQKAATEMDSLRNRLSPLDDAIDIVEMLRKDRLKDDA